MTMRRGKNCLVIWCILAWICAHIAAPDARDATARKKHGALMESLKQIFSNLKSEDKNIITIMLQFLANCQDLPPPAYGKSVICTDGSKNDSVCTPVCSHGYRPANSALAVCKDGKWDRNYWMCEDVEKPVFTSCPTKKIVTKDTRFRWTVTAQDNDGEVTLKQVQGHPPGSPMQFGVHVIKYVATDASDNSASCEFIVELKVADCPKPSSSDTDMKFKCNGLTAQSVCHLSCESGSFVQGSKYIACVADKSGNNTSYWEPIDGEKATCYKKTCPTLSSPKNGALACDKQLGGTVCQIQCDDRFDVAPGVRTPATYICSDSGVWTPRNVVPDCLEMAYPDEYFLPTEFFYFIGDCSDPEAIGVIKQQFIDNLISIGLSPCISEACSVEDIDVSCGSTDFRKKRSAAKMLRIRVIFHLRNRQKRSSPADAEKMLKSLVDKAKGIMSSELAKRYSQLSNQIPHHASYGRASRIYQPLSKSVIGRMWMKCSAGLVQSRTGACVTCPTGTYADTEAGTCRPCPLNTFQNETGSTSCQRCPVHHSTSSTGSPSREDCKEMCNADTFSPTGVDPCFPCPEGKHQPEQGATTCVSCPERHGKTRCPAKKHASFSSSKFKISNFLLSCGNGACLYF